jgi:hypothetical protein
MRCREFTYVGFVTLIDGKIKVHHTQWTFTDPRFMPEDYGNEEQAKIDMASAIFRLSEVGFGGGMPADGNYRLKAAGDIILELEGDEPSARVRLGTYSYGQPDGSELGLFRPYVEPVNKYVRVTYEELPA